MRFAPLRPYLLMTLTTTLAMAQITMTSKIDETLVKVIPLGQTESSALGLVPRGTLLSLGPLVTPDETTPARLKKAYLNYLTAHNLDGQQKSLAQIGTAAAFQQIFTTNVSKSVPSRAFTYSTMDGLKVPRVCSGRVFLPPRDKSQTDPTPVPLVIYQHATETRNKWVPSNKFGGDETMFGAMAAGMGGFAVAMPDGDGMGVDDKAMHHYCYGPTNANCLIDCIRALVAGGEEKDKDGQLKETGVFDNVNYVWNGQTYIVGYSEGGYIALAAVKELSTKDEYKDIVLTGAACMGGPFEFTKSTLDLLSKSNTTPYDRPYIPAYFMKAWETIYPNLINFKEAINPKFFPLGTKNSVDTWLDGTLGGDPITVNMNKVMTGRS